MKRNLLLTDALREVRHTFGRFLSLFLLSALAVMFLAGLRTTSPDMERSADLYYDELALMDLRVLSTLGLTAADVSALAARQGVALAEGAYSVDAAIETAESELIVHLMSMSDVVNRPRLVSGRLPTSANECLVEPDLLTKAHLSLGDTARFDTGTGDFKDALTQSTFTVVGTATSPLYISAERGSSTLGSGRISCFVFLPSSAFQMEAFSEVYLRLSGAETLLSYDDAYTEKVDAFIADTKPLALQREGLRSEEVIGTANQKLSDAQREYDDGKIEADAKLLDAETKLAAAKKSLADGKKEYTDGLTEYADGAKKYGDGLAALTQETADANAKISAAERVDLPEALRLLKDGEAEYTDGAKKLEEGQTDYDKGRTDYAAALVTYQEGYDTLTDQLPEFNDALQKLQDGEADYKEGAQTYRDGIALLQDGGKQLQDGQKELETAQNQLFYGRQDYEAGNAAFQAQVTGLRGMLAQVGMPFASNEELLAALAALPPDQISTLWMQISALRTQLEIALMDPNLPPEQAELYRQTLAQLPASELVLAGMVQQILAANIELTDAKDALDWGQRSYEDGKKKLKESQQEFDEAVVTAQTGSADLTAARKELDDGWAEFYDGKQKLENGWADLDDGRTELLDAQKTLADAQQELVDGQADLTDARKKLDDGWADYRQGVSDLADAKLTLQTETDRANVELTDAKTELDDAKIKLDDAKAKLTDGEKEYKTGLIDYETGKTEAETDLADGLNKLNDAKRKIADIEHCKWYLLGRDTNVGYVSFQQDAQRMSNLASIFPLIFFLVAALVCLTTMTRMVEEQRVQIGSLKALGYGKGAIAIKYVGYGLAASLSGGLFGLALGCTVIPWVIYTAWGALYTLGPLVIPFYPKISIFSVSAAVLTVTGAAALTCYNTLSAVPATLMRPKTPALGKRVLLERITPIWKRLTFTHKVTARNLLRYQRRFWMTVIGIGGCTALIVTGFGLRDSIFSIMNVQYDEIYAYHSQINLIDDVTQDELTAVHRVLDTSPEVAAYFHAEETSVSLRGPKRTMDATLFVPQDEAAFPEFIHLRHRQGGDTVTLPQDGAVLTEKLADLLGVKIGEEITLGDDQIPVRVADITENYILHYLYLSPSYYEVLFGAKPSDNAIFTQFTENTSEISDRVAQGLVSLPGVNSIIRAADTRHTFQTSMESVNYAVAIITVAAAALAFVVLFNLTNINITERQRELATLKVLGFYDRELNAYVFRENAVLTILGIAVGLVMGKFLHQWLVLTVEIDMVMFGRSALPQSYLYAVLLTALFAILVNLAAQKKLKKIDMVESLKTVE